MAMPQPPHKTDGITKIQRRESVIVEDEVEPSSPDATVMPQIFCILPNIGSFGCALSGDAR